MQPDCVTLWYFKLFKLTELIDWNMKGLEIEYRIKNQYLCWKLIIFRAFANFMKKEKLLFFIFYFYLRRSISIAKISVRKVAYSNLVILYIVYCVIFSYMGNFLHIKAKIVFTNKDICKISVKNAWNHWLWKITLL